MTHLWMLFLFTAVYFACSRANSPILTISCDSPAILGSNITFVATLLNYSTHHELTYVFDDGIQKTEYRTTNSSVTANLEFLSDKYSQGFYFMNVTVTKFILWYDTVAANSTRFNIKRELIGGISVYRDSNVSFSFDVDEVAVGESVYFVLKLHDPSNFLKNAKVNYGWDVDWERIPTMTDTLVYNFTDAGPKQITAIATAVFPDNYFLYGLFKRSIVAKVPVNNVTVSGNPFLYHGDKLNLNITCDGTPPFVYCADILKHNISSDNFTCKQPTSFTSCHMEIMKYIQEDGKYNVGIYISNDVHTVTRILEVMVYSVTVQPTLSTVIIPIVCSLLGLIIIASGITYCVQQRNQMAVEVANFDFHEDSDSYTEQTFFEKICNSFMCRNCRGNSLPCMDPNEVDPLI